ncbi:MAG: carboxypeptidase-like regulatory domain-containing protein [Patescibacteria group bacterium]
MSNQQPNDKEVQHSLRGLSLIDTIVGISIITIVFFGLFGAFKLSVELVYSTKAKISAVALLGERLEYIRSFAYDDVGTVGGIPPGNIEPLVQSTVNGVPYTVRTLVQYTDAPEDGLDDLDENGITADYKTVKVEVLWMIKESSRSTFAVTRIAPVGLETLAGGGTLRVNVFDALAVPVSQASVRVVNGEVSPSIDVTAFSNQNGVVSFPGAPEATGYEVYVSKEGYSTAQTYAASTENPNPSPSPVSVAEGDTTTVSFAIDQLGSLHVTTEEPPGEGSFNDSFLSENSLSATSSVHAIGGALVLEDVLGVYALSGSARSLPIAPDNLVSWDEVVIDSTSPTDTSVTTHLYYLTGGAYVLVPDSDLPNNSTGLPNGVTDISLLNPLTYATLQLEATFSSDGVATPQVDEWETSYRAGPTPLPNIDFTIFGTKTIGTTAGGAPIYKFDDAFTTSAEGEWLGEDMEWDVYSLFPEGGLYDVVELCPRTVTILPATLTSVVATLLPNTAHSLRVVVESDSLPVTGASVSIQSGALQGAETTSACGQVYFGGLTGATYSVSVTANGFQDHLEDIVVAGDTVVVVPLISN